MSSMFKNEFSTVNSVRISKTGCLSFVSTLFTITLGPYYNHFMSFLLRRLSPIKYVTIPQDKLKTTLECLHAFKKARPILKMIEITTLSTSFLQRYNNLSYRFIQFTALSRPITISLILPSSLSQGYETQEKE